MLNSVLEVHGRSEPVALLHGVHGDHGRQACVCGSMNSPNAIKASHGLHLFERSLTRKRMFSGAPISLDTSIFSQMGRLPELDNVYAGRTLELIPTITGSNTSTSEAATFTPDRARMNGVNRL